ncbi:MAG: glutathione S-transferase family protein [Pseudomonadota bacterium]
MSEMYRIVGAELSPFSVKVRSFFRYKGIPHEWISRSLEVQEEYATLFKVPIIPLVVAPDGTGMQDSSPLIESIERIYPEPSIHPEDTVLYFISCLLEEFGDEWANKWMFHYRWARELDQQNAATRIVRMMRPGVSESEDDLSQMAAQIAERMTGRVWFVGSSEGTALQIENGFQDAMSLLDKHLASRPYLLGERPCYGDFGLYAQVYNATLDPTPAALIAARYQNVLAWTQRMLWPRNEGDYESWDSLESSLAPLLRQQVGERFLSWSVANQAAILRGAEEFTVELAGQDWTQKPQKYHAKSLESLRDKYETISSKTALDEVLGSVGCLEAMARSR